MLELILPYPPSTNRYWRHVTKGKFAGRTLISEHGRAYRTDVLECWLMQPTRQRLTGPLVVDVLADMPDNRRRDIDNLFKALLDALTHAGVWDDDNQVVDLRIRRGAVMRGGQVRVTITKAA